MNHQPGNSIDKVLAALRDAASPEGMNARIAARLEQQPKTRPATSRWRSLLTGQSLTAAWLRGAATGAAFALLAVAAILALRRAPAPMPPQEAIHTTLAATRVSASRPAAPCPHPAVLRLNTSSPVAAIHTSWTEVIAENTAPSRPAPPMPLTAQERQLARLVRTSDPNQLAAISHVTHTQQPLEEVKPVAPPPAPPAAEVPAETKPEPNADATPDAPSEPDQPSPEAPSDSTSPANQ